MRSYLMVMLAASLIDTPAAFAADKTIHDDDNGFSLTFPETIGAAFSSPRFTNEHLTRFPDGYPARVADMDFRLADDNSLSFYGHSRIVFSIRKTRFGYVNCGVVGDTAEQAMQIWGPLATDAEKVVKSFALDPP